MTATSSSQFDPLTDIVDLKGKVIIVTGGNKGIGYGTVQHLARGGAKVYLAARNEERARIAIETLREGGFEPGNGDVAWLELDLSDPRSAKHSAEKFLTMEKRLDVLGLTSIVHKMVPSSISFKTMEDFNLKYAMSPMSGMQRYGSTLIIEYPTGLTKLMDLLWTMTLQERLSNTYPSAPITVIAVHPGGVDTFTHNWPFPSFFKWLAGLAIADTVRGSYNSVFAAASKKVAGEKDKYRGAYLESSPTGRITEVGKSFQKEELRNQLWETTEGFLRDLGL
ncbi:hypothetical protein H0H92_005629 [Tricholoma furcatifolium]|nr:hypothetical protein H0H92_005629 [Tricholoma furcatifolium]